MKQHQIIESLLEDTSHHIEFNGHLTNHVKHAVVALTGLGLSPDKIKDYYENYANLTTYGYPLESAREAKLYISDENWKDHLGQRLDYKAYYNFFDQQEKKLGLETLLNQYIPQLIAGWAGAFTHATIHLGWGLDVMNRQMIIEGLAYMAFTYISCHPERASLTVPVNKVADQSPMDSILRISAIWNDNPNMIESQASHNLHPELVRSGLQFRIACMLEQGHPLFYQTQDWLLSQDISTSWQQLYYVVTLLYLCRPGDFVILHLITSLYAMENISLHCSLEERKEVLKCYWIGMIGIIFSESLLPKHSKLISMHNIFNNTFDEDITINWESDWNHIIARSFEEEEEHNPKLVYVLKKIWHKNKLKTIFRSAAGQFTKTPELPASFVTPPNE